jgi:hypothetical protein
VSKLVTLKDPRVRICREVRDGQCISPTHRIETGAIVWTHASFSVDGSGGVLISLVIRTEDGREVYRLGPAPLARGGQLPPTRLPAPFAPGRYVVTLEGEFIESANARRPLLGMPKWEFVVTAERQH